MKKELKKETRPLTSYDHNVLLPIVLKGLETKKGKINAVTSKQILRGLQSQGLKIQERDVFMLINYIRTNDLVVGLMSTNSGYYITNSEQDFMKYEGRLLGREKEIRKVRLSIIRQRQKLFAKRQHELF